MHSALVADLLALGSRPLAAALLPESLPEPCSVSPTEHGRCCSSSSCFWRCASCRLASARLSLTLVMRLAGSGRVASSLRSVACRDLGVVCGSARQARVKASAGCGAGAAQRAETHSSQWCVIKRLSDSLGACLGLLHSLFTTLCARLLRGWRRAL